MTDEDTDTLALARDVAALLQRPEFHKVFARVRERLVATMEGPATTAADRREALQELRALRRLRSGFDSLRSQAETIRSNNLNRIA